MGKAANLSQSELLTFPPFHKSFMSPLLHTSYLSFFIHKPNFPSKTFSVNKIPQAPLVMLVTYMKYALLLSYCHRYSSLLHLAKVTVMASTKDAIQEAADAQASGLEDSPVRYVLIIQSNVESGPKMIQFNIQFKINFEIFIQSENSFKR